MAVSIRAPRRPPGWRPPGPAPAATVHQPEVWPHADEELCCLTGDWRILQRRRGHRWSLDDLVTAWFAVRHRTAAPPRRIADLGCGIGAVLLMLAWRFSDADCVGIEAQPAAVALARRSAAWNGAADRCRVQLGDLRDATVLADAGSFDLVTGTPPYVPLGTGRVPTRPLQAACHLEYRGGIEAYCNSAARLLAAHGRFIVCHAAAQTARAERAAETAGLAVVERIDVIPRSGKPALFAVSAMRPCPYVPPAVLAPLVVRDERGAWSPDFRALRGQIGMPVQF